MHELPVPVSRSLQEVVVQNQVTLYTLVQAIWGLQLSRYNGGREVVFGSVVSGRPAQLEGVESMVGLFINMIPVRVGGKAGEPFSGLLKRLQQCSLEGEMHQYYPLAQIQADSALRQQLLDHFMVFANYPSASEIAGAIGTAEGVAGITVSEVEVFDHTNYDFNIIVVPGERLKLEFSYNGSVLEEGMVRRMGEHFGHIAEQVAADNDMEVEALELLGEEERHTLLEEWPCGEQHTPEGVTTIQGEFRRVVLEHSSQVALRCGGREVSYGELDEQSDRLSRCLREGHGVGRGEVVGLYTGRSEWAVISMLGILKAGGSYVYLDPSYPSGRLEQITQDAGIRVLITDSTTMFSAGFYSGGLVAADIEVPLQGGGALEDINEPGDSAYIIYTSGSTGRPKGVAVSHGALLNTQAWRRSYYGFDSSWRSLQVASYSFDSSVNDIYSMLLSGGSLLLLDEQERMDSRRISLAVSQEGVTHFNMVPGLYRSILEELPPTGHGLKLITLAGERLGRELLEAHFKKYGHLAVINEYGPTENAICSTALRVEGMEGFRGDPTIGRPIWNTRVYVLDDALRPVAAGVKGELYLSGPGLALGYRNNEEQTKKHFTDHPYRAGERLYRTGDVVRWTEEGELEYLGRRDEQVKIRGYRVELSEIEGVLATLFTSTLSVLERRLTRILLSSASSNSAATRTESIERT